MTAIPTTRDETTRGSATAAGPDRPELQKTIEEVVGLGFGGLQLRVHDERGMWAGSAGVREQGAADRPPTDGHFWIGSTTKTFVATLVLQLVAEGLIGLDDPVADRLPRFGLDGRITVRMLLQHTSGLYNYTGELEADGTFVPGIDATGRVWAQNRLRSYRPEELVEFALAEPARFEPGAQWSYSNTNYTLAVLLIEAVTGRPYAEEMRRRILDPLGLSGTSVPGDSPDLPEPHARGYYRYEEEDGRWTTVDVTRQSLSLLVGAGDMISTTLDLHTFFSALLGGRLLPDALLEEMCEPDPVIGYGLGVFVQDLGPDRGTIVHHNGSPPGGYGALMIASRDGGTTLTASLTMGDAEIDPAEVFPGVLDRLLGEVFPAERSAESAEDTQTAEQAG